MSELQEGNPKIQFEIIKNIFLLAERNYLKNWNYVLLVGTEEYDC